MRSTALPKQMADCLQVTSDSSKRLESAITIGGARIGAGWGHALQEAGFTPNALRDAYSDEVVVEKLLLLDDFADGFNLAAQPVFFADV
jgi:hypothetical protein